MRLSRLHRLETALIMKINEVHYIDLTNYIWHTPQVLNNQFACEKKGVVWTENQGYRWWHMIDEITM